MLTSENLECVQYCENVQLINEKIQMLFSFDVPFVVSMCIADNDKYCTLSAMLSIMKINKRISNSQLIIIKQKIKKVFNIKDEYERLNKSIILKNGCDLNENFR